MSTNFGILNASDVKIIGKFSDQFSEGFAWFCPPIALGSKFRNPIEEA
jgi:hypothetical protein